MLIHYCEKCGQRVAAEDLEAGRARKLDEVKVYCPACTAASLAATKAEKPVRPSKARPGASSASRPAVSPPARGAQSARTPRPAEPAPRAAPAPDRRLLYTGLAGGGAVLLLAGVLALGSKPRHPENATADPKLAAETPSGKEPPGLPAQAPPSTLRQEAPARRDPSWMPSQAPDTKPAAQKSAPEPTPPSASGTLPQEEDWKRAVNLLAMIQPEQDAISGQWSLNNGVLATGAQPLTRLGVPYIPAGEYDMRLVFMRKAGDECLVVGQSLEGRGFSVMLAGWKNKVAGFEVINDQRARDVTTNTRDGEILINDKRHTAIVQVRRNRLRLHLDGKLLAEREKDLDKLSMATHWAIQSAPGAYLGLGTIGPYEFYQFEVLELTGKGKTAERPGYRLVANYDFAQGKDLGWRPTKNLKPFVFRDSVLATEATGPDAYMTAGAGDYFASDISHVAFRMRSSHGGQTEARFATAESGDMAKNGAPAVACKGGNEWQEYEVRLAGEKNFSGKLKTLRLDPVNGADNAKIEFAWIRLIRKGQ